MITAASQKNLKVKNQKFAAKVARDVSVACSQSTMAGSTS